MLSNQVTPVDVLTLAQSLEPGVTHVSLNNPDDPAGWVLSFADDVPVTTRNSVTSAVRSHNFAAPTAHDVRAEASRRLQALVNARDAAHLEMILVNGTREAVRLLRKGAANWTTEETARAATLESLDASVEAIRAASNVMEASPPDDYADDSRWP